MSVFPGQREEVSRNMHHLRQKPFQFRLDSYVLFKIMNIIEKFKTVHGNRYDYVHVNYINSTTKVQIVCEIHGLFLQTPHAHLKGHGCRKCGIDTVYKKWSKSTKQFIKESIVIHGDKYDYSASNYINSTTKVQIVCKIHGSFWQAAV